MNVFFCLLFKKCIIKQLLNSVFAWYHELSKPRVCIICLSLRLRQITQTSVLIIHDTMLNLIQWLFNICCLNMPWYLKFDKVLSQWRQRQVRQFVSDWISSLTEHSPLLFVHKLWRNKSMHLIYCSVYKIKIIGMLLNFVQLQVHKNM